MRLFLYLDMDLPNLKDKRTNINLRKQKQSGKSINRVQYVQSIFFSKVQNRNSKCFMYFGFAWCTHHCQRWRRLQQKTIFYIEKCD